MPRLRVKDWLASFFENGYTLFGRLKGHSGPINCISFRRDGTLVASGGKFFLSGGRLHMQ